MAGGEDLLGEEPGESLRSGDFVDALAASVAGEGAKSDPKIAAKTAELLTLQIRRLRAQEQLIEEEHQLELSHLRWRRFNDQMRGALQVLFLVVGFAFVVGIGAVLWNAHEAKGLVVAPLRMSPDFAEKGLDGTMLAQRLLDKLNKLVLTSNGFAARVPDTIEGSWGDDSKVEIPNTGISVSELERSLKLWLGHETHISGEVWHSPDGISISVRAGSNPTVTLSGKDSDLDELLDHAAEQILAQTQPYSYASLLASRSEWATALKVARRIALSGPPSERFWAFDFLAGFGPYNGRTREAVAYGDQGVSLEPDNPYIYASRQGPFYVLGEFERGVADDKKARELFAMGRDYGALPAATAAFKAGADESLGEENGDFESALRSARDYAQSGWYGSETEDLAIAAMAARGHDLALSRTIWASHPSWDDAFALRNGLLQGFYPAEFFREIDVGDWSRAAVDLDMADHAIKDDPNFNDFRHAYVVPWLAYALAMSGQAAKAQAEIATCSADSYPCLEMHGRVAAVAGNVASAADWFGQADVAGPSIPFADTDWGELLLRHGDYDAAIAKFASANSRSPHFADPLEMWGEALMQKNRSDLALAKFEEANKCAPNWGRLHLEWGKALFYAGQKSEAKEQFLMASALDLSASDRLALAKWRQRND